ncbi:MAG TPA: LysM peptidoglycan-binding domain-containing protein [Patescibacteria group bacterium]|nr:LysM peptidoglycan-binding domain-containing protein [Patescibacteria group bacterium]
MKPSKDILGDLDLDKDWIHTEVLGQGKKKSNFLSNLTVICVIICTVILIFIGFKELFNKNDLSNLNNMDVVKQTQQAQEDQIKAAEEAKKAADAAAELAKKAAEAVMTYTVKSGDTLAGIAADFKVDMTKIAEANGLKSPYALEIGQQLKIPGVPAAPTPAADSATTTTAPAADGSTTYTVKSGDTLAQIGADLGVDYKAIMTLNGITDASKIDVGQVLKIPKKQ